MDFNKLIQAKDVKIGGRVFVISKIPAIRALSIYNSVADSVSKHGAIGISMLPYDVIKQILGYTALIDSDGTKISLDNDVVIEEVFKDIGDIQSIVAMMCQENFDFFLSGKLLDLLLPAETVTE